MKRILALVLCTLMTVALLAGCGSKKNDDTNTDKTWVVATDTTFRPFEYTDKDGNFVGIDVDIMAAVAADQGFKYELKSLGWDAAIAACKSKQANAMIAGASIKQDRTDSDIKGFGDLSGKAVAVKTGTMGATYAESLKDQYGFTLSYYEDSPTMYQAVIGGQAVACFEDTPIMITTIKENSYDLKVVEGSENDGADYGVAVFDEENRAFLDLFNKGLANIKANGTYDKIIAKYLG